MAKESNPGAIQGTEIVFLGTPFGGWESQPTGVLNTSARHYFASIEGVQGALSKESANTYAESDGVTLFSAEKYGHMAPGHLWTQITDTAGAGGSALITDLPLNGNMDSIGQVWTVLKNGRLVRVISFGTATANKYDPDYSGSHSGHTGVSSSNCDLVVMNDFAGTQVEWAIWSWEDNTDADINIEKTQSSSLTQNWFSGLTGYALTKGVPHKMCKGPDGNLYILNGNYVQQMNITAGMAAATVGNKLNLGADYVASGIVSYKNYVAILAYKTASYLTGVAHGDVLLFLWDGTSNTLSGVTSTAPQYAFPIQDNYASGLFFDGNTLFIFTNGRNETSKIWEFTGKAFKKVFENGLLANSSTPIQGSLESFQDSLMIGAIKGSNAHLFRYYGGFHDEGIITDGTYPALSVGMVKSVYLNQMYVGASYSNSGTKYTIYYYANNSQSYQLNSQIRTILFTEGILGRRLYPLGFKGTVNRFYIYLSQWGAGAALYLSLFKDYTQANPGNPGVVNTDLLNLLIDTDTTTPNGEIVGTANNYFGGNNYYHLAYPAGTTEIDISSIAIPDISSFYMILTWAHLSSTAVAAIIRHMVVYWSPSQ